MLEQDLMMAGARGGAYVLKIVDAADRAAWTAAENELLNNGVRLPFSSRSAAGSLPDYSPTAFVAVSNGDRTCVGGFAIQSRPAPLLRSYRVLRVEQLGSSLPVAAATSVVADLLRWIIRDRKILRVSIDLFSFDAERRQRLGQILARNGFRRAGHANGYVETLAIDLAPTEEQLFQSLHHSTRRKLRQLEKQPVVIRTIDDAAYSDRMNDLARETFARTGGQFRVRDWGARIKLSNDQPDVSRIVGLFRSDVSGPESLLAYAWGCHSNDYVYYSEAASTRDPASQKIALAYGLMWDLILWAKRTGARWFDMGGITRGTHTDEDPLGGISDFKRYFTQNIVEVREEWLLDNHTWQARFAAAIHKRLRGA